MKSGGPLKRKTPLKSSGFKPSSKKPDSGKPRQKRMKSKQRSVTPEEKLLWDRLATEIGCVACMKDGVRNTYVSIHHIDGRTKPGCHKLVLPLCAPHHQQDDTDIARRVAVHPNKARFEKLYGTQLELLDQCMQILERTKNEN